MHSGNSVRLESFNRPIHAAREAGPCTEPNYALVILKNVKQAFRKNT